MQTEPIKKRWHILILCLLTLAMVLPGIASLPVLDRDEARYAQSSAQMVETGDWINIRYQDEARNKKPAGAYWAQAAALKAFNSGQKNIWVQRLPSMLAALLSVLTLYWGGLKMVGRRAAFFSAILLSISLIFVFEGHVAKTDALLCAAVTAIFSALGRMRNGGGKIESWVFWIALGAGIMFKGPIAPALTLLSILTLWIWERDLTWLRPLLNLPAIILFLAIWVPWATIIHMETDGMFFKDSLGKDFGGKLIGVHEHHSGLPGYYSALLWITLWPASLYLLPGLIYGFKSIGNGRNGKVVQAMRLALAWVVPFWILIELMPTKLPHYALPAYPALCLMAGTALLVIGEVNVFAKSRFVSGLIFLLVSAGLIMGVIALHALYNPDGMQFLTLLIITLAGLSALAACFFLWMNLTGWSFIAAILSALIFTIGSYGHIFPSLTDFYLSERLVDAQRRFAPGTTAAKIHSPHFTEPSLVYNFGTDINLNSGQYPTLDVSDLIILDVAHKDSAEIDAKLSREARSKRLCLRRSAPIKGTNYSRGASVTLILLRETSCHLSTG